MTKVEVFTPAWLVWVKGTGGRACPQVWRDPFIGSGLEVLVKHNLPPGAETYLSLDSLAELYPLHRQVAA